MVSSVIRFGAPLISCTLLVTSAALTADIDRQQSAPPSSPLVAESDSGFFWNGENCCGTVAAFIVCRQLGIQLTFKEVASELPPRGNGVSMDELYGFFLHHGLKAEPLEMTSEQLCATLKSRPNSFAIVLVQPLHWVAVYLGSDGLVHGYDYPRWSGVSQKYFKQLFKEKVIIVDTANQFTNSIVKSLLIAFLTYLLPSLAATSMIFAIRKKLSTSSKVLSHSIGCAHRIGAM